MIFITKIAKGHLIYEIQFEDGDTEAEIQVAAAFISLLKSILIHIREIKEEK